MTARNKNLVAFLLFCSIALVIVVVWFRVGKLIATGEDGLWLYEPKRTLRLFSDAWSPRGLGGVSIFTLPRIPIYIIAAFLSNFIPSWLIQAILFFWLISMSMFGMYKLSDYFFDKEKGQISVVAGLFYFFNLYSQSQVWRRFSAHLMFFWSLLPLFFFLWIKWIDSGKRKWLVLFTVISVLYSYSFSSPALMITALSLLGIWFVVRLIMSVKRGQKRFIFLLLKRAFVALFSFTLFNIWWVYPYLTLSEMSMSGLGGWRGNFNSLRGVSKYFPTSQILLLRQSYLFSADKTIQSYYSNPWLYLISFVVLFIVLLGLFESVKKKLHIFLLPLLFSGWFISKGTNPPFGLVFFRWLFRTIPQSALLRNPYEKYGLVWLIPYSILFSLGVGTLFQTKGRRKFVVAMVVLFASCGVLVLPVWTGKLFSQDKYIRVPRYYSLANELINSDKSISRILSLPMTGGDAAKYNWKGGNYRGGEPSEFLFDKPSVSKVSRSNRVADNKYFDLYQAIKEGKDISRLLDEMNIKYLVFHEDYVYKESASRELEDLRNMLTYDPQIKLLNDYGGILLYEYLGNSHPRHIEIISDKNINMNFNKVSNTYYRVDIQNAKDPYKLVLKESFHNRWTAYIGKERVAGHFLAYKYANVWNINRKGNYTIDIVFKVWPWE